MSLQYIIDGYNVIKHSRFVQQLPSRPGDSRVALLESIRTNRLAGSPKNRVTVIFDGYPDTTALRGASDIRVIFTGEESADERIKKIVEVSVIPKATVVVSDDKEIKFIVRSFGARCLGVEEFLGQGRKAQGKAREAQNPELTYSQMEEINKELRKIWLK
jgi:predicted RNA-binding protein with PIN domain